MTPVEEPGALRTDVLIAGGGYVGLSLALALRSADPTLAVAVADPVPAAVAAADARASAIAAAARRMLAALGVWEEIAAASEPILEMVVTDSRLADPVRPVFLTFGDRAVPGEPFAHMVPNGVMVGALRRRAEAAGVVFVPEAIADFAVAPGSVTARRAGGGRVAARLLVAADGARSRLRDLAGIRTVGWSYGQSGIVTTVEHERPHGGRAEEHFLPAGPFAILPLPGNRSSLVWTERTADAERLVALDDFTFALELERRFGHRLGAVRPVGPRRAFPLGLTVARAFVAPRFALCGDAAHGIHPIAGQGLNLGFRDVAALAETVVEAHRLGLDIGAVDLLRRYERWRRYDTVEMAMVTDGLNRLFSNDLAPVRLIRDVGLGLVDRLPRLKRAFIGRAAHEGADGPRLLRGEAL
nr:ubiquinone biosynthesis hydroxylase [Prosthecomicrobium pneumaticum]